MSKLLLFTIVVITVIGSAVGNDDNYSEYSEYLTNFSRVAVARGNKALCADQYSVARDFEDRTWKVQFRGSNKAKNRIWAIPCWDQTRVKLNQLGNDSNSDYIHANFIDSHDQRRAYISVQCPLLSRARDFWRMIAQEKIITIVMNTKVVENGKDKCSQYWPLEFEQSMIFENFEIVNNGSELFPDYTISTLIVSDLESGERHVTHHFHFFNWPDHEVPSSVEAILNFRVKVREYQARGEELQRRAPPIVVHCSAGIGRTGTFILLDMNIRRINQQEQIDIQESLLRLRRQRAWSMRRCTQCVFLHKALIQYSIDNGVIENVDHSSLTTV
jgi:protein tyrosine phosphatase